MNMWLHIHARSICCRLCLRTKILHLLVSEVNSFICQGLFHAVFIIIHVHIKRYCVNKPQRRIIYRSVLWLGHTHIMHMGFLNTSWIILTFFNASRIALSRLKKCVLPFPIDTIRILFNVGFVFDLWFAYIEVCKHSYDVVQCSR